MDDVVVIDLENPRLIDDGECVLNRELCGMKHQLSALVSYCDASIKKNKHKWFEMEIIICYHSMYAFFH